MLRYYTTPPKFGAPEWTRTTDLTINSRLLPPTELQEQNGKGEGIEPLDIHLAMQSRYSGKGVVHQRH